MAYRAWSVVYAEQPSAAKWNILGSNDAHFYSFLGDSTDWTTFTPTFNNVSGANNTLVGRYQKIGRVVRANMTCTLGAGFSISGTVTVELPITAAGNITNANRWGFGYTTATDIGTSRYAGGVRFESTNRFTPLTHTTNPATGYSGAGGWAAATPFTWVSGDIMRIQLLYEAAA